MQIKVLVSSFCAIPHLLKIDHPSYYSDPSTMPSSVSTQARDSSWLSLRILSKRMRSAIGNPLIYQATLHKLTCLYFASVATNNPKSVWNIVSVDSGKHNRTFLIMKILFSVQQGLLLQLYVESFYILYKNELKGLNWATIHPFQIFLLIGNRSRAVDIYEPDMVALMQVIFNRRPLKRAK